MYLDRRSDDFLVLRFSYSCNIALWGTHFQGTHVESSDLGKSKIAY